MRRIIDMPFNPMSLIQESGSASISVMESAPNPHALRYREKSFFLETLEYLSEMNLEYHEATRKFYSVMAESAGTNTDVRVIHEGFGDFFDTIKKIVDKFLDFIKSLFMRFLTMLNNLIGRDKYILNHKDELSRFTSIHEFDITGYVFTINSSIPVIEAKASFESDFVFDLASDNDDKLSFAAANRPNGASRLDAIKAASKTLSRNLEDDTWYDNFRGQVLNQSIPISRDDFADKLFSEFRNGESISEEITVTNYEVTAALRRFKDSKSDIDKAKKLKSKIDSEYNSVKKSVEKMVTVNRTSGVNTGTFDSSLSAANTSSPLTGDEIMAMDIFTKAKATQIQEMSNIHAIAFAAKLDAMTDCYKQDKNVLFKALSRVQSTKEA